MVTLLCRREKYHIHRNAEIFHIFCADFVLATSQTYIFFFLVNVFCIILSFTISLIESYTHYTHFINLFFAFVMISVFSCMLLAESFMFFFCLLHVFNANKILFRFIFVRVLLLLCVDVFAFRVPNIHRQLSLSIRLH